MKSRPREDASYGFRCPCDITHLCGFFRVFCADNVGFEHSSEDSYRSCGENSAPTFPAFVQFTTIERFHPWSPLSQRMVSSLNSSG